MGLRGSQVESVTVNEYNVVVTFSEGGALSLEGRAELAQVGQAGVSFNDEDIAATAEVLGSLPGSQVLSGVAFKSGALRIVLDSGAKLRVPFAAHYEAWQLTGPSGRTWVSLPGGGLQTYPPEPT
nr:DUF6188 family protein [Nocardioides ginsengisegetis]